MAREKPAKWFWIVLGVLIALQLYFVRALLAAYFLFAVVFAMLLVFAAIFLILEEVGERCVTWAEARAGEWVGFARRLAHRDAWARKVVHRPGSRLAG
jgi:hypothetical protein